MSLDSGVCIFICDGHVRRAWKSPIGREFNGSCLLADRSFALFGNLGEANPLDAVFFLVVLAFYPDLFGAHALEALFNVWAKFL